MEAQLSEPSTYSDKDKFKQTEIAYQKLSNDLKQLNAEYEEKANFINQKATDKGPFNEVIENIED